MGQLAQEPQMERDLSKGTPAKIIDAAKQLFWHQGYKATSLDDIARTAGQSKGAFFHYFRSKNDVARLALNKYAEEEIFTPLSNHFSQSSNIKEALLGWGHELYSAYGQKGYKGGCLLGNMNLELSDRDEDVRQEIARLMLEWENRLTGFFKEEGRSGELLMEPRQFARVVIASLQGTIASVKGHKDKNRAAREFQALAELFERLIKG